MRNFRFYKENNKWYIDLPEWEGDIGELQMVCGADVFLDLVSQGENERYLILSKESFENADKLLFLKEENSGAWYRIKFYHGLQFEFDLWLCHVTTFVFKCFPEIIYFL